MLLKNNHKKIDIVFISNSDWNGFWFQRQEYAKRLAENGHNVYFINRSPQRWPKLYHFINRFKRNKKDSKLLNRVPDRIKVITPRWIPPVGLLKAAAKLLVRHTCKTLPRECMVITYLPTYNTLYLINELSPKRVIYVNVHNYDADRRILGNLLDSEKKLIKDSDVVFGDSCFNKNRVNRYRVKSDAFLSPPGVNASSYMQAYRGDETCRIRKIFFFGGFTSDKVNFDMYNQLALYYKVIVVGAVTPNDRKFISNLVEIRPPVSPVELPNVLREADALALLYKSNAYVDGIIPAKLFECISTLKPIFVSGLKECRQYSDALYDVGDSLDCMLLLLREINPDMEKYKVESRRKLAYSADWNKRFDDFYQLSVEN